MDTERVPLEEAARLLGLSKQGVRERMKRGMFVPPIGYVENPSGHKNEYRIYRRMLNRHMGCTEDREEMEK